MNVLLSIKPEFAVRIFEGTKRYEYRRVIFKRPDIRRIVVYASSPVQRIIGEIQIAEIIQGAPRAIWKKTHKYAGVDRRFFFDYFVERSRGYAIKIGSTNLYKTPIDPKKVIEGFRPPQSFAYITNDTISALTNPSTLFSTLTREIPRFFGGFLNPECSAKGARSNIC